MVVRNFEGEGNREIRVNSLVVGLLLVLLLGALPAAGQAWDTTGNGQLNGTYYFREVSYATDQSGDITDGTSAYGNITFSGSGTYSITIAQVFDVSEGEVEQYSLTGTYSISASGYGFMSSPNTELSGTQIIGLVSNGIFIGSSTESGFNDFLVAAPTSSSPNFSGSYSLSYLNFINLEPNEAYDALVQISPNGSGSIGNTERHVLRRGQHRANVRQRVRCEVFDQQRSGSPIVSQLQQPSAHRRGVLIRFAGRKLRVWRLANRDRHVCGRADQFPAHLQRHLLSGRHRRE